jgi:hypothetical protein
MEDKQELSNTTETAEIVPQEKQLITVQLPKRAYISVLVGQMQQAFNELSADLNLGFVRLGDWLSFDGVGNFVEHATKGTPQEINLGNSIDVVIAGGEARWSLWGAEGTALFGRQIIDVAYGSSQEEMQMSHGIAINEYRAWSEANEKDAAEQEAKENGEDAIRIRYRAVIIPVAVGCKENRDQRVILGGDELPRIYLMSFSPSTSAVDFGPWTKRLMMRGDPALGIKPFTRPNDVVVRMTSKSCQDGSRKWIGINFQTVGKFNPEEFGLPKDE